MDISPKKSPLGQAPATSVPSILMATSPSRITQKARAGEALAQDLLALGEDRLLEEVDDRRSELRSGQVGEQREAGDRVDQLLAFGHGAHRSPDVPRSMEARSGAG